MRSGIALDSETELIEAGRLAPPLVCVSVADATDSYELFHHTEAREAVVALLESDSLIIGDNVAFDFSVFAAKWPELLPLIFEVYEADRVSDTEVREKLNHIAMGVYRGFLTSDGKTEKLNYSLADLVRRHLGIELDKGEGGWQLRFGELMDVPLEWWPAEAREYALTDVVATLAVWQRQEEDPRFLEDEFRQTRAAFWLQLMSCWGMIADPEGVRDFARRTQLKYDAIAEELKEAGLMRANGVRDTKAVKKRVVDAYVGKALRESGDTLAAVEMKLVVEHKQVKNLIYVDGQQAKTFIEMTTGGKTGRSGPQPKTDADVCERSGDAVLEKYADLSSLKKTLSTDVPLLMKAVSTPLKVRYESLVSSGRTASVPNVQNLPVEIGVRECFRPRPGCAYAVADYSGFELRTWAQVCLSVLGQSKLAEVLNAGFDPHLEIARRILGISYEEAAASYKRDPKGVVYYPRQTGKVCFHPDTEVLTRSGWRKINTLSMADEVCSAILSDDGNVVLEWGAPLALTSRHFSGNLVHMKNEGIDLRVTPDHRMCGWKHAVYRNGHVRDWVATCLPRELGKLRYWPNAGLAPGNVKVDERLLRLAVAVQADGNFQEGFKIRLGFTKKRKIDRLRSLLQPGEYVFKFVGAQRVSTFYLEREISKAVRGLLTERKTMPWWWTELEPELRSIVLDEVRFWDSGAMPNRTGYTFASTVEENADVLQALATLTLRKSRKTIQRKQREEHRDCFYVSVKPKHRSRGGNLSVKEEPYSGEVYCLKTHNDTVVVRDGGVPVITRQCNFGKPGGLGTERLIDYARKSYGVILFKTADEARANGAPVSAVELSDYWQEAWPESRPYFDWINRQTEAPVPVIRQLFVNRYRGDVKFTDAANTMFQGLAADAAKAAGFLIARACYVEPDSPLFGCRPANFVHDEFVVEVPDDERAHDAAVELARLMVVGASPFLPDVPPTAEPLLCRKWSKSAKPVYENGRLVPWDFPRAEAAE